MQNSCIRRMCHINWEAQKKYRITSEALLQKTNLPTLQSIAKLRVIRFLERIALSPPSRITRQAIACQVTRPLDHSFKGRKPPSLQSSYRRVLESAGLCPAKSAGALIEWMPKLAECNRQTCELIDEKLGLPKGTYSRGRRQRTKKPTKPLRKEAAPFFPRRALNRDAAPFFPHYVSLFLLFPFLFTTPLHVFNDITYSLVALAHNQSV